MGSSKTKIRGVSRKSTVNPNLTQIPYITGGVEGSVQYKGTNNALAGDSNFIWGFVNRILSIFGNVLIRGNSSTLGNALEVRNAVSTPLLEARNSGLVKAAKFGFDDSNYVVSNGSAFVVYIAGVFRFNMYSTQADFTIPVTMPSLTVGTITSTAAFIARGSQGSAANPGFDVRCYGGNATNVTFKSGKVLLGYRQQNGTDVNILSIEERTANSTDGVARIIFKVKEVFADNAAALAAGCPVETFYRTPTGEIRVVI